MSGVFEARRSMSAAETPVIAATYWEDTRQSSLRSDPAPKQ